MELKLLNFTIKDVAKEAGVSVATVSRVLNNTAVVSSSATEQVNDAIKKLNYKPNFLGRNLRKCETKVILAIFPGTEQSFYSEIIRGMQDVASDYGYDILLNSSSDLPQTEMHMLSMLFNRTVDAAVLLGTHIDAKTLTEINDSFNIALCCERVVGANVLTITVDDENGAYSATKELIKKGHKKIGIISTNFRETSSIERENGFRKALEENGITPLEEYFYYSTYKFNSGCNAVDYFMALPDPPTAIFAISDLLAIGAVNRASKLGYSIGKDFSIIGFDNIPLCEMYMPTISTVAQPCFQMGQIIIKKLIENMNCQNKCNERVIMPCEIKLRESTGD